MKPKRYPYSGKKKQPQELVKTQSKTFGIVKSHFEIWSKSLTF